MGSKWRKARLTLSCLHVPSTVEEDSPPSTSWFSDSDSLSLEATSKDFSTPSTLMPSSSGLRLPIHGTETSKRMCAICLTNMKPGDGHAIFTGECSHSFHFHCITSKVKHGNQICPICRAKWKEIPFQNPPDLSHIGARLDNVSLAQNDDWTTFLRRLPPRAHSTSLNKDVSDDHSTGAIEVKTYPKISAVSRSTSHNNFTILVHLKALTSRRRDCGLNKAKVPPISQNSRAPVDLVAVPDVSGSMAGYALSMVPLGLIPKAITSRFCHSPFIGMAMPRVSLRMLCTVHWRASECGGAGTAEARVTAEQGDLAGVVSVLEGVVLKAYVLSGLSSHSWQRATARGDSTDSTSLVQSYQTPSMVDMVNRSQTVFLGSPLPQPPSARRLRQAKSFPAQPQPR
ncbi:zinc finger (C3HC4-type RING finger) family protein [Actinidia rufa]|uniref:Zinc finger (C3HC4-type RING finger) family protein n=1 Tax=Actinidia rufa TaxID=165716 RepID=A0A7J0DBR2_9ERIC|nr:zinc finger (C3HC4-type RING finger) family protein [Actinidia rufa]